jgi:hypothetical protein
MKESSEVLLDYVKLYGYNMLKTTLSEDKSKLFEDLQSKSSGSPSGYKMPDYFPCIFENFKKLVRIWSFKRKSHSYDDCYDLLMNTDFLKEILLYIPDDYYNENDYCERNDMTLFGQYKVIYTSLDILYSILFKLYFENINDKKIISFIKYFENAGVYKKCLVFVFFYFILFFI